VTKRITINGEVHETILVSVSYAALLRMAGMSGTPSGTYRYLGGTRGILKPGDRIGVADGLEVSLCHAGNG
jgi:hypothetical protein